VRVIALVDVSAIDQAMRFIDLVDEAQSALDKEMEKVWVGGGPRQSARLTAEQKRTIVRTALESDALRRGVLSIG